MHKVGQNHTFIGIYGVYTVFLAGESRTYGHIRCIYTVLANPTHASQRTSGRCRQATRAKPQTRQQPRKWLKHATQGHNSGDLYGKYYAGSGNSSPLSPFIAEGKAFHSNAVLIVYKGIVYEGKEVIKAKARICV
jgi:hypothetical protein